jgi:hypothetical protein
VDWGFGERRWEGRSRGAGEVKNVEMWFRTVVRVLFSWDFI